MRSSRILPDRIGQGGDFAQAFGHGGNAFVVELQPVEHGWRQAVLRAEFHVQRVGFLERGGILFQRLGHRQQTGVLFRRRQLGEFARRRLGLFGQARHLFGQIHAGNISQFSKSRSREKEFLQNPAWGPLSWLFPVFLGGVFGQSEIGTKLLRAAASTPGQGAAVGGIPRAAFRIASASCWGVQLLPSNWLAMRPCGSSTTVRRLCEIFAP